MDSKLYPALQTRQITLSSAEDMATGIFAALQDGAANALQVFEELVFMAKVAELLRAKPGFTEFMRSKIQEAAATESTTEDGMQPMAEEVKGVTTGRQIGGATFSTKLTGVKYDYADTGDPAWIHYNETMEKYKPLKVEREKFLKAMPEAMVVQFKMPDGTTVTKKVHPPTKTGTESFEVKLPK